MLVVFTGVPIPAPGEAVFGEKAVAQIGFINFIGEVFGAVGVGFAPAGGDVRGSIGFKNYIRVKERIDINRQAVSMFGEVGCAVHYPVIKAGGIIVLHGEGIVSIVFINKADLFDLIFIPV